MSALTEWEKVTNKLVKEFCLKYFEHDDYEWVAGCVGGTFEVNGYYLNLDRVTESIKHNATYEDIVDYYELEMDYSYLQNKIKDVKFFSFKNYVYYKDKTPIKEEIERMQKECRKNAERLK